MLENSPREITLLRGDQDWRSSEEPYWAYLDAAIAPGSRFVYWIRAQYFTDDGIYFYSPYELGVTDLDTDTDRVLLSQEHRLHLANRSNRYPNPALIKLGADSEEAFLLQNASTGNPSLQPIPLEGLEELDPQFPASAVSYGSFAWLSQDRERMVFRSVKAGFCEYRFLGGYHLPSEEWELYYIFSWSPFYWH